MNASFDVYKKRLQSVNEKKSLSLDNFVPAAVLIPFFIKDRVPHVLFTQRTHTVKTHKGQISFPGGAFDSKDHDLKITALRETEEEIGVARDDVEILAELGDMRTPTNFRVTPFVGIIPYPYEFKINPHETAELIQVPLEHLFKESNHRVGYRLFHGKVYEIHYYDYENHTIWGVTGFILFELLGKLRALS